MAIENEASDSASDSRSTSRSWNIKCANVGTRIRRTICTRLYVGLRERINFQRPSMRHMKYGDRRIYVCQQSSSRILLWRLCGPVNGLDRCGSGQALRGARLFGCGASDPETKPSRRREAGEDKRQAREPL